MNSCRSARVASGGQEAGARYSNAATSGVTGRFERRDG